VPVAAGSVLVVLVVVGVAIATRGSGDSDPDPTAASSAGASAGASAGSGTATGLDGPVTGTMTAVSKNDTRVAQVQVALDCPAACSLVITRVSGDPMSFRPSYELVGTPPGPLTADIPASGSQDPCADPSTVGDLHTVLSWQVSDGGLTGTIHQDGLPKKRCSPYHTAAILPLDYTFTSD
jgi:hypothetical protein